MGLGFIFVCLAFFNRAIECLLAVHMPIFVWFLGLQIPNEEQGFFDDGRSTVETIAQMGRV